MMNRKKVVILSLSLSELKGKDLLLARSRRPAALRIRNLSQDRRPLRSRS
jgi:hypothetical protein